MKTVQHHNDNRIYDRIMLGTIMVILGQCFYFFNEKIYNSDWRIQQWLLEQLFVLDYDVMQAIYGYSYVI